MTDDTLDRETAENYARWFHALSDPTRVMIVHYLSRQPEPVPVSTIVDFLGIGQSSVSRHLMILHQVRFVTRRRRGTNILYTINNLCEDGLPHAAEVVLGLRTTPPAPPPSPRTRL